MQGVMSSMYLGGYRVAMIFSGAGSQASFEIIGETQIYSYSLSQDYVSTTAGLLATRFLTNPIKRKIGNHFKQLNL